MRETARYRLGVKCSVKKLITETEENKITNNERIGEFKKDRIYILLLYEFR
jgi:hypothetical protein